MRRQWLFATIASTALILTGCSPDALDSGGDSADNVTAIATSLSPPAAADAPPAEDRRLPHSGRSPSTAKA